MSLRRFTCVNPHGTLNFLSLLRSHPLSCGTRTRRYMRCKNKRWNGGKNPCDRVSVFDRREKVNIFSLSLSLSLSLDRSIDRSCYISCTTTEVQKMLGLYKSSRKRRSFNEQSNASFTLTYVRRIAIKTVEGYQCPWQLLIKNSFFIQYLLLYISMWRRVIVIGDPHFTKCVFLFFLALYVYIFFFLSLIHTYTHTLSLSLSFSLVKMSIAISWKRCIWKRTGTTHAVFFSSKWCVDFISPKSCNDVMHLCINIYTHTYI